MFHDQRRGTVNSRFKKVHFSFLKSRVVWFRKDLCSESKNQLSEKNALCRWICNLRSFLNREFTVILIHITISNYSAQWSVLHSVVVILQKWRPHVFALQKWRSFGRSYMWVGVTVLRICHGLRTPNEAFFHWNPELLGLSWQIMQINSGAFQVFSSKLRSFK